MHIGFEAKRFFTNFTGLGNYARFVINSLSEFFPEHSYSLFSPKIKSHPEFNEILSRANVNVVGPEGIYKVFSGLWRSYGVSKAGATSSLDLYHGLSHELPAGLSSRIKKVVTVHDLIFLRFPQYYSPIDVAIYKAKVSYACKHADKIIAISQQTAADLIHFLNVKADKISVVYQGCHPNFKRRFSETEKNLLRLRYNLPSSFILNVGTIENRKNLKLAVEALPLLNKTQKVNLVIVGRPTKYKEVILRLATELSVLDQMTFLHDVSFGDLPGIYQMAKAFVYPSFFEGFGIPLIEAIESGVPVVSSVGSCFSEAAGPHSIYVDPTNKEELAKQLSNVLTDVALRSKMISGSSQFISKFAPQVIADDLMAIYRSLV